MVNTTFFVLCTMVAIVLATSVLASESFGQAEGFLHSKAGKDKDFDLAGYDAAGYDSLISMDDDDDYHDDQYLEIFSFIQNEPEESSIDLRACTYQCDGKCYNPLTHQCCNGLLLSGFWSCSKCKHRCADRCYPKGRGFKCCFQKVIPDAWQCCAHHCNGRCFNAETHKCCYNLIIPRSKICCKPNHYCGGNCYDPTKTSCCNDQVIDKGDKCCASKCGQQCYDKTKMKCCHNQVIAISAPCCPSAQRVCGNTCYLPSSHKCCHNKVIPIERPCCTSAQRVCGNTCYLPSSHKCCHERILSNSVPCISGSGNPLRITTGLIARRVGCFRDTWTRAIPTLERHQSRLLTGSYRSRHYAIEKCALAAARRGWSVFAVQHQGWCASSPIAGRTYNKYGPYNTCRNGKGGPWGNDVYVLEGNAAKKTTTDYICVFPFIYKGKTYNSCTNVDRNRPWCAITPNYDVDRLWGYC